MNVFENLVLNWEGKVYTIPSNRMMGAIARLEEIVTLSELREYGIRKTAPIAKLAMAYAAILRYAGAEVLDEDVYVKMASGDANTVMSATRNVMLMMLPPSMRKKMDEGDAPGEEEAAQGK